MKRLYLINGFILACCLVFGNATISAFSTQYQFTVPSRGIKYYEVRVPENAKQIKAVISGQTEMVSLALYAPGKNTASSKNSTWSNLSNWKKAFKCSVSRPKPGIWKIQIKGSVAAGNLKRIKQITGTLKIYVE